MTAPPLADRSAVITGASRGLGRAIARHFVEAGAGVLLVARTESALAAVRDQLAPLSRGASVEVLVADVAEREAPARIAERAHRLSPPCAVLVNNAGVYGPMGPLESLDLDAWEAALRINLMAPVRLLAAMIPLLRERGFGKVINLSGGGATAPLPFISSYAASKAALVRLTETFAHELRPARIDVDAIAPGALNTSMLEEVLAAGPEEVGEDFHRRALEQKEKGGASLERGAALAVFLASARSDGISGRLLSALWDDWERLPEAREKLAASDVYTLRRIVPEDRGWAKS
jgi:3-oxoacyl-[acyl-carrier protein] reductase